MTDLILWVALLALGYWLGKHRNSEAAENIARARSGGYAEGVAAALNAFRSVTVEQLTAKLKKR